jgi:hypothetical protein
MPNVIANDIIGVSPMVAPRRPIGAYVPKRIPISNGEYGKFVRLYNRRKTQSFQEIVSAGYNNEWVDYKNVIRVRKWARIAYKENSYIWFENNLFFSSKDDHILYKIAWLEIE